MNEGPSSTETESPEAHSPWWKRLTGRLIGGPRTREDLKELLEGAQEDGLVDADAARMIEGVFETRELQARDIMVPRAQMVCIERDWPLEKILAAVIESGHSRYPIIGDTKDEIAGVLLALWLAALAWPAQAEPAAHPGETLRASLLTFAPGETYWQRFGHNALLIENTATGANAVYNYGMFDFFQKNFFLNFARGRMLYRLDVDTLPRTLALYASEGRWVRQQVLNLSPERRLQLALFLDRNAQPDQAQYRYDYFRDNCSTRVRDAIDSVLGGAIARRLKAEPVPVTYRFEATRLMRPIWPLAVGMDAILGPAADVPMIAA